MFTRRVLIAVVSALSLLLVAGAALGLPPFSLAPQTSPASGVTQAEVHDLRVACHPTFDRFVVRARLGTPAYRIAYVPQIIHDSSGLVVPLRGTRRIRVVVRPARAHTLAGSALTPTVITPNCPQLRQVKNAGDFEGVVTFGIGVRQLRPFRVFRLTNPTRIVVDLKH